MNLKEIREIIHLMNEHDLCEIELERDGTKVKIKKTIGEVTESTRRQPREYAVEMQVANKSAEAIPTGNLGAEKVGSVNAKEIKSPMVGTFYRAASPEAPPFVEIGQTIAVGQVVCIVEAMKLMNEIKSEVHGKIVEVHIANAQPVEFGQTLFSVESL